MLRLNLGFVLTGQIKRKGITRLRVTATLRCDTFNKLQVSPHYSRHYEDLASDFFS